MTANGARGDVSTLALDVYFEGRVMAQHQIRIRITVREIAQSVAVRKLGAFRAAPFGIGERVRPFSETSRVSFRCTQRKRNGVLPACSARSSARAALAGSPSCLPSTSAGRSARSWRRSKRSSISSAPWPRTTRIPSPTSSKARPISSNSSRAATLNGVTDAPVQRTERECAERDLVGGARRSPRDDPRRDGAPHRRKAPADHGASIRMRQMQRRHHISFVFSSHDPKVLEAADDAVHIHDGRIISIERRDRYRMTRA